MTFAPCLDHVRTMPRSGSHHASITIIGAYVLDSVGVWIIDTDSGSVNENALRRGAVATMIMPTRPPADPV
jgi:hypothetical protein